MATKTAPKKTTPKKTVKNSGGGKKGTKGKGKGTKKTTPKAAPKASTNGKPKKTTKKSPRLTEDSRKELILTALAKRPSHAIITKLSLFKLIKGDHGIDSLRINGTCKLLEESKHLKIEKHESVKGQVYKLTAKGRKEGEKK